MVPGVGDDQPTLVHQHPGGQVHAPGGTPATGRRPLRGEVGLAEHDVRGGLVRGRDAMPDEHPVVARVRDDERVVVEVHPTWRVHERRRRLGRGQGEAARRGGAQPDRGQPAVGEDEQVGLARPGLRRSRQAHGPTLIQTYPSSTRSGICSSWAPGALMHSPDSAS